MYETARTQELYHHGVKGMKWGVRKKRDANVEQKRAAYRQAKKDYNKAYRQYDAKSLAALSPIKKHRQANDERFNNAVDAGKRLNQAKSEYKQAKKAKRAADKAVQKMAKIKIKDLQKQYGELEDKMTYGKNADAKANARIEREMNNIDDQINKLKNNR